MKYFLLTIYLLISAFAIFLFTSIEQWLIQSNFSWTSAKLAPYLLLIILGFLLARWMRKFILFKIISNKIKFVRPIIFVLILAFPFSIGFALNPIYEGDFSKKGIEITADQSISDFKHFDLAVIAIPGCPYCYHCIAKLRQLKARNPEMRIKFIVCTTNNDELKDYKAEGGKDIEVRKAKNIENLQILAEGKFPCFVMIQKNKAVYRWSNDQFGCLAMDELEHSLTK